MHRGVVLHCARQSKLSVSLSYDDGRGGLTRPVVSRLEQVSRTVAYIICPLDCSGIFQAG